ncbi:MAG: dehydrogenase subunit, partial [Proteobacteria bacterium]|nr:dehydrogenase subunit [Pseudomonadota bacterium]
SAKAIAAQKGVMEFLLINHPLDCPICDQGGECELQDLAVGYGGDVSRYQEMKRVVKDKDIGPLIATEMTRCIHCTRCVRFGEELAGVMELGATGRGEHMRIGTYVAQSVDSELSGNMIDLCPVGALTSKPFRYSARTWELNDVPGVSPHDCVGANLNVQVRRNKVMRVLPRENEYVNEIWLADRDRFSYEAVNSTERLLKPMVRANGTWRETDWSTALNVAVDGMQKVIAAHGPQSIGALASPTSTVEEFYLLQKLVRTLGSGNVDHRLRQRDFSDDAEAPLFPYCGLPIRELETVDAALLIGSNMIRELETVDAALLIGSNIRKDQPLLGLRLRKAFLRGAMLFAVNPVDYDFSFDLKAKVITDPAAMPAALARIAHVLAESTGASLPPEVTKLAGGKPGDAERAIAVDLKNASSPSILIGNYAMTHPQAALLRALADLIAELSGARLGILPEANGAGGWLAGCVPQRGANGAPAQPAGRNAADMFAQPLKGYFIFGAEPELDGADGKQAQAALKQAGCVVAFSAFKSSLADSAHVLLPLAPFTETDGTFVNAEGRFQTFNAAVTPSGDARPGWKILRVLGNLFKLAGFDYTASTGVLAELQQNLAPSARLKARRFVTVPAVKGLQRIAEVPMYSIDPLVRRAAALQTTRDNTGPVARMHPREAQKHDVGSSARLRVIAGGETVTLDFLVDRRIPEGCVLIPAGCPETLALGGQDVVHVEAGQ